MKLRPPQKRQVRRLVGAFERGASGTLDISATGTGKTLVETQTAKEYHALSGYASLHMAPTIEVLDQTIRAYQRIYAPEQIGIMHGSQHTIDPKNAVIISTPHTVREAARYKSLIGMFPQGLGALIADEGHHFVAPQTAKLMETLRGSGPAAIPMLFTATAERADEKHLLDLAPDLSAAYDLLDAMHDAYIPDLRPYTIRTGISLANVATRVDYDIRELELAVNVDARNERAVNAYREYGENLPAVAFCAGVNHAIALAQRFNDHGITAAALHDDLTQLQRRNIVAGYRNGNIKVLTGYNIPLEGLDVDAHVGLWLRPTKLEHIYTQAMGRLLRPSPDVAAQLGDIHDVAERRAMLDNSKGHAIMLELRDDDPRAVRRPTVGIASMNGLPPNLELTGEPIRYTSQRMDVIASRMPERARLANSDSSIKVLADMAEVYYSAPEIPLLPAPLLRSRAAHNIPWQPHGPRRYAAPLLLQNGSRIREDALVISAYGDVWAVEHARHGVRTPIFAEKTFERAIEQAVVFHRQNHVLNRQVDQYRLEHTPADLARLGSPLKITIDDRTMSIREAILTEININPNAYRDRAALWDRSPLAQPRRVEDRDIAHTSMLKVDIRQQNELIRESAKRVERAPDEHVEEKTRPAQTRSEITR